MEMKETTMLQRHGSGKMAYEALSQGGKDSWESSPVYREYSASIVPTGMDVIWPWGWDAAHKPIDKYQMAAWCIEDALRGLEPRNYDVVNKVHRQMYLMHEKIESNVYYPVLFLSLVITLFEVPLWCDNGSWWHFESADVQCPTPDGSPAYFSHLPYLPKGYAVWCELMILVVFSVVVGFKWFSFSEGDRHKDVTLVRVVLVAVMVIDFVVFFLFNHVYDFDVQFRLAGFLRVILFFTTPDLRYALENIGVWPTAGKSFKDTMLAEFINVAGLLFGTVIFFAWVMAMALDDVKEVNHAGQDINEGFEDLPSAIYTLFEASTTQNFPDQMIPTFTKYRSAFFVFFVFMVLCVMIFLNLVLAVVYNKYSDAQTDQKTAGFKNRKMGVKLAFDKVQAAGTVQYDDFEKIVICLNRSPVAPFIPYHDLSFYWATLDDDNSGAIDEKEFGDFCEILKMKFTRFISYGYLRKRTRAGEYESTAPDWLQRFVHKPPGSDSEEGGNQFGDGTLDQIVNIILIVNSLMVLVESLQDLGNVDTGLSSDAWAGLEFFFSWLYVVEIVVRISVIDFKEYWADNSNKLDFLATVVLFLVGVLWAVPQVSLPPEVLRYFTILRLLRLVRLLASFDKFQFIAGCISRMFAASSDAIGLIFGICVAYAYAGTMLFGGLIYDGNEDLAETDYKDSNYDVLNFNDMGLGMVSLFAQLITAFVPEFYEVYTTVCPWPMVAAIFWISFYIIGIMIGFNIFASLIIDVFVVQMDNKDDIPLAEQEVASLLEALRNQEQGKKSSFHVRAFFAGNDDIYKKMFEEDGDEDE